MRITLLVLATPLVLAACGTKVYDVQPYGPGQFVVYSKSKNQAEAHSASLQAANDYCAKQSKTMQPAKADKVAKAQFELIFTCQ